MLAKVNLLKLYLLTYCCIMHVCYSMYVEEDTFEKLVLGLPLVEVGSLLCLLPCCLIQASWLESLQGIFISLLPV